MVESLSLPGSSEVLGWLLSQAKSNQFFSGGAVLAMLGGALVWGRDLVTKAIGVLRHVLVSSVRVQEAHDPELCQALVLWMTEHPSSKWYKNLTARRKDAVHLGSSDDNSYIVAEKEEAGEDTEFSFNLDVGTYWVREGFRLIHVSVSQIETKKMSGQHYMWEIHLRTLGFRPKYLRKILMGAWGSFEAQKVKEEGVDVFVSYYDSWTRVSFSSRSLDSVVYSPEVLAVMSDAKTFLGRKEWYLKRGVPWRRGYLLSGPPGTGKSTFGLLLATELAVPVYVLQISELESTEYLSGMLRMLPEKCVLMVEDIDAAGVTDTREGEGDSTAVKGVTLSGLLNAIDGIGAKEGRIMVMTTNHPEKLDAALTRDGRVDMHVEVGPMDVSSPEVRDYVKRFLQRDTVPAGFFGTVSELTMAEVQGRCLRYTDPQAMS